MQRLQQLIAEFSRTDQVDPGQSILSKHQKMALNPFRFLRGSSGLFYADIQSGLLKLPPALVQQVPFTTVMGDCHISNFGFFTEDGSYGQRVIFAPNDFDDACIGPAVWDLSRYIISLLLAADGLQFIPGKLPHYFQWLDQRQRIGRAVNLVLLHEIA